MLNSLALPNGLPLSVLMNPCHQHMVLLIACMRSGNMAGIDTVQNAVPAGKSWDVPAFDVVPEAANVACLLQLSTVTNLTIYGPNPCRGRAALCSFNVEGLHATDISTLLDQEGESLF